MIKVLRSKGSRIKQGDLIANVEHIEYADITGQTVEISRVSFPYIIVLTQDCDLVQDYHTRFGRTRPNDNDKQLVSVLVAPLYNAEHFYVGEHLSELDLVMQTISRNKTPGKKIRANQDPRYHFLAFPSDVPVVDSVIDFKHYFSVSAEYLRKIRRNNFVGQVAPLYREDISHRFASFLARVGLPPEPEARGLR